MWNWSVGTVFAARFSFLLSLFALVPIQVVRAQGSIVGTVTDAATSAPLARVTVLVVGTRIAAETDAEGRYALTRVPAGTHRLRARLLVYAPLDTSVAVLESQQTVVDFRLQARAIVLEERDVVAVGYGTQTKADLTGSVGSVSSQQIATLPVARVDQAIAGLVAGVQVQTTNAQPGSQLRIRVRGGNSLRGDNEPLVVVDGVIGADLNQISTSDIESIDVLKDASATAIYGARAANGVILVTTKRGEPGQIRFAYSGYTGVQSVTRRLELLSADEFARLYMRNPTRDESITLDTSKALPTTDWQDVIYHTAPVQNHQISVSGRSGSTGLWLSAALFNQKGVVIGSDFARGSLRFNLDQDLGERFRVGTRVSYSRSVGNEVRVNAGYGTSGGPVTMAALRFAPTVPVYDANGNFSPALLPSQQLDNPLAIIKLRDDKNTRNYLIGNVFGEYDLVPGLTLRGSLAYTYSDLLNQRYISRRLLEDASLNVGQANIDDDQRTTWLSENTVTFRRTLAERHELTLLGGFTAQETRRTQNNAEGRGFTSDLLGYRRLNLAEEVTGNSSQSRERLLSFLGRVNYSFAGRYLLTATVRSDGSSKFATNNKWAYFPSAAVAWRASEEPFFRGLTPAVSELKLRLSVGRTGSEAISAFQSLAAWCVGDPYAIGTTTFRNGATPCRNPNPNLRWETTTQYDLGLDLGLFDNRVSLTADAYHKTTSDLLYEKQVPFVTGFEEYVTNIGKVRNRGLELALDTRHTAGAFEVRLGGILSLNRSEVLDLGGDREFFLDGVNGSLPRFRPAAIVRVGEPLGNFFGYIWDGIFQNQAEIDQLNQIAKTRTGDTRAEYQAGARVGGMKLKDTNGRDPITGELTGKPDGKIDPDDRTILGNAQPRYLFSQTGSVTYKALSLSYIVRAVLDFDVVNLNRQGMETPGGSTNMVRSVLNYWTPTNPTNTMTGLGIGPYDGMTSRWVEEGSFVRLQNVTLEWEVPRRFSTRLGMGQMRLYLSGQNLLTATRYSWYDSEVSSRGTRDLDLGWDDSSYPGIRTVTFGVNASF